MKLERMELTNFQGIKSFAFEPKGKNTVIRGTNAAGKTTLFSAFKWLLFDKDAQGRSEFAIKPVGAEDPECVVEATLSYLDEQGAQQELKLKKTLKGKYIRKRGEMDKTFTGNVKEHFINESPMPKKDWDNWLRGLIDEETFRLLTDPMYFNSLHWEKRRQTLIQICGDVSDEDVIAANPKLETVPSILEGRTMDMHRATIASRKKAIDDRRKHIPTRIDELIKTLPLGGMADRSSIEDRILTTTNEIRAAEADSPANAALKERLALESLLDLRVSEKAKWERAYHDETETLLHAAKSEAADLHLQMKTMQGLISALDGKIITEEKNLEMLRVQYSATAARKIETSDVCPACKQTLPEEKVQATKEALNQQKAKDLADINAKGKSLKQDIEGWKKEIAELQAKIETIIQAYAAKDAQIAELQAKKLIPVQPPAGLIAQIDTITNKLKELANKPIGGEGVELAKLRSDLQALQMTLAQLDVSEKTKARIEELKAEEKSLVAEYETLMKQTALIELFTLTKVQLLESRINSRFELARFKLFEQQINGAIAETCTTTYAGVPYGAGLNRGMEINVGLDIIKVIGETSGKTAPVWIDNAEAVIALLDPGCQMIKLVVDEKYPSLNVEYV